MQQLPRVEHARRLRERAPLHVLGVSAGVREGLQGASQRGAQAVQVVCDRGLHLAAHVHVIVLHGCSGRRGCEAREGRREELLTTNDGGGGGCT